MRYHFGGIAMVLLAMFPWVSLAASPRAAPPQVVVTIKPLYALVSGVMQGVGRPELLLPGSVSPHSHALRPSEARLLRQAELIFWVGDEFETFLVKPLQQLAKNAKTIALHEAPGITLLANRELGAKENHPKENHLDTSLGAAAPDAHHHGARDMHIWLGPDNALAMTEFIGKTLAQHDPSHAVQYRTNALDLAKRIQTFAADAQKRLDPIKDKPFIVFHDAYRYFENYFGLRSVGFLSVDPERPISARRLQEIHATLGETGAACIFAEPQFEPALIDAIIADGKVRKGVLDPLGADAPDTQEGWFVLMDNLVTHLTQCLAHP
ncbi:MAG: zinc ABC transporter substrate-binding protein [Nitrospirae bacterium]|nr:zinc ABC transporter substrate-binding protein [Magnetococcales bacterium]HAT51339.1 zinc ABC transporter substrate-binding protein [Alphaproteobacteria bacterium]